MKITRLETVRVAERANLLWLLVHTDEGLTGLGETFFGAETVEAYVHEYIAPRVIGRTSVATLAPAGMAMSTSTRTGPPVR